jgi:hypothetical protein
MKKNHYQPAAKPEAHRSSPQSDPTNPAAQEKTGVFVPNEQNNERRLAEPGLTDKDRAKRDSCTGTSPDEAGCAG